MIGFLAIFYKQKIEQYFITLPVPSVELFQQYFVNRISNAGIFTEWRKYEAMMGF